VTRPRPSTGVLRPPHLIASLIRRLLTRRPRGRAIRPTGGADAEIYFSVVQRKVISPNDFRDLSDVESRLLDFQQHYEQIATPFEWKFTKNDLNALLERTAAHDNADSALAACPQLEYVTEIPCQTTK
jgi:hypothetical protein